jgi:ATP-dependent helicase/nuclease subunit A
MNDARLAARVEIRHENRRLLYVAMTRAIEKLVVCGIDSSKKRPEGCWYDLVRGALEAQSTREPAEGGDGEVLRFRKTSGGAAADQKETSEAAPVVALPAWLRQAVVPAAFLPAPIKPSSFGNGAAQQPVSAPERLRALARGNSFHRLIQSLPDIPRERRAKVAAEFLARALPDENAGQRRIMVDQVLSLLDNERCAALFGPGSRAEVPIVGTTGDKKIRVNGQIDRLVVAPDFVLIADFKTNRPAPRRIEHVPPSYVTQLALYRAVLAKLYPDKTIRAALIWTEATDLMELSAEIMDAAMAEIISA